jgi:hypothetical protein
MARTANPYTQVIKRLAKLQAKADKLNAEIAAFSKFVEAEAKGKKPASPATGEVEKEKPNPTNRKTAKAPQTTAKGKKPQATSKKPRGAKKI